MQIVLFRRIGLLASIILATGTAQAWATEPLSAGNTSVAQAAEPAPQYHSLFLISEVTPYKPVYNSGYVDLGSKIQSVMGETSFFSSVHGGWIINHNVYLGLGAYALQAPKDQLNSNQYMQFNQATMFYGGVEGGYRFSLSGNVNLRAQLLLGLTSTDFFNQVDKRMEALSNDSLLIEPGIYADLKVWGGFGVSLGVHYHFTQGADDPEGITSSGLNQTGLELTLKWAGD
jgi:hypothetical protein